MARNRPCGTLASTSGGYRASHCRGVTGRTTAPACRIGSIQGRHATLHLAAAAVDIAMQKGVNYPRGPFEWARAMGLGTVRIALASLAAHYGEDRYRTSPVIARRVLACASLDG